MSEIIMIGGGAAGMFCSILAARDGHRVTVIEKNEKPGKKLFITGKGRCNFTNRCAPEEFLAHVVSNPRFLYSAAAGMTPEDVISCFEGWGLVVKTERGRRMFPASDHSSDVIRVLTEQMKRYGVRLLLHTEALEILTDGGQVTGVRVRTLPHAAQAGREDNDTGSRREGGAGHASRAGRGEAQDNRREGGTGHASRAGRGEAQDKRRDGGEGYVLRADRVVVATGGLSYPSTGSTGDGYRFAEALGHRVTETMPSLVPIVCAEEYVKELQGLSLRNVKLTVRSGKKEIFGEQGEMMFTHFGITGPLVLSASALAGSLVGKKPVTAEVDLKPALSEDQLDARLVRIVEDNPNKILKNVLPELYPSTLHPVITALAGLDPALKLHSLTKEQRRRLVQVTKAMPLTLTALRGYNEAVVTRGGVSVRDVSPGTMESRKVKGLFFIGEVLDLDAYTGGYNLQIAWCTAAACAAAL